MTPSLYPTKPAEVGNGFFDGRICASIESRTVNANPHDPVLSAPGGVGPACRQDPLTARRRLLRDGLGNSAVLMVSAPRSVLAVISAPTSRFLSTSASAPPGQGHGLCAGRLPDFWEAAANSDAWGGTSFERTGNGDTASATTFDSVFGVRGGYPGRTLLDVLRFIDGRGKNCLARHLVAAVLNASKGWTPTHVLSVDLARHVWASFVANGYFIPAENIVWYCDTSTPAGTGCITAWLKSTMS